MQITTAVTQKGQVTIPIELRRRYNIGKYSRVVIKPEKRYLKIMATEDVLDLAGSFKPRKKVPVLKAREEMEKTYQRF